MNVRRLNDTGMSQLRQYLAKLREDAKTPLPGELIDDARFTEAVSPIVEIERPTFASKFDAGDYLNEILKPIGVHRLRNDTGIWGWLTVWFFDQVCPVDGNGRRKPLENSKYVPQLGNPSYGLDKHLIFFPWKMSMLHGEAARFILAEPLKADSRAQREWTGYLQNCSIELVKLGKKLYWDEGKQSLKRGATSLKRHGNLRRFVQVARQLDVTFDTHGMNVDQLYEILPRQEFRRWWEE